MTSKVSVIMAAWNAEKTISGSIASVQTQTFSDWELVIADDGSTDKTAALVEKLAEADSRIRLLRLEHGGAAKARNAAVRASNGEYLAILDSDDTSVPDRLETQVAYMDAHPDVLAVGGWCRQRGGVWRTPCSNGAIRYAMAFCNPFSHSTVMFRRQAFGEGYRTDLAASEDFEILSRIGAVGKVANLPKVLSERAFRPESIGARIGDLQESIAAGISEAVVAEFLPDEGRSEIAEFAKMNFFVGDAPGRYGEFRAMHSKVLKRALAQAPQDAMEIRRFDSAYVADRKDALFGNGVRERALRALAMARYYWNWPKALAYAILTASPLAKRRER